MAQEKSKKRPSKTTGIKALIASASVAASLAGWALLPSNDPQATASPTSQQSSTLNAPGTDESTETIPQLPAIQQPTNPSNDQLPQVQAPRSSSNRPMPFTNSHSSR